MSAPLAARAIELLLYQVLTGAITRTIATEVTGQDLDLEQSTASASPGSAPSWLSASWSGWPPSSG